MKSASLAALTLILLASQAEAGYRACHVADPTGTPLNVRVQPAGEVVGTLENATPVNRAELVRDHRGSLWAFVQDPYSGNPIGWVFSGYLACP